MFDLDDVIVPGDVMFKMARVYVTEEERRRLKELQEKIETWCHKISNTYFFKSQTEVRERMNDYGCNLKYLDQVYQRV